MGLVGIPTQWLAFGVPLGPEVRSSTKMYGVLQCFRLIIGAVCNFFLWWTTAVAFGKGQSELPAVLRCESAVLGRGD
jgi:hypothetical protein